MSGSIIVLLRYVSIHICHSVTLCLMCDCRYSRRVCRLAWTAIGAVFSLITALGWLINRPGSITNGFLGLSFLMTVGNVAAFAFLSKRPWQKAVFVSATYFAVFFYILEIAISLNRLFFNDSDLVLLVLRTGIFAVYILLLLWKLRPAFRDATEGVSEGWGTLAGFGVFNCVAAFLAISCVAWLKIPPIRFLVLEALLLCMVAVQYLAIIRMVGLQARQEALRSAESQRKLLESQLDAEREFVALASAHRHDARHHIALLNDYLEREDMAGMREYLSQYLTELEADKLESYCVNPVADALLRLTARRCRERGVACAIRAAIPEKVSLSGPELAVVLGNILENAWEAARECRDPRLAVTVRQKGASLLVEVENTVDHPTRFEGDLPATTKPVGGQGLRSVQRTLEKHGGMLQCSRKEDTFYTQVVIPL